MSELALLKERYASFLPEKLPWARLDAFYAELLNVARPNGFVGKADDAEIWRRHILDSLVPLSKAKDLLAGSKVVDLGSGAGLPAIPLALSVPSAEFLLIEAHKRRAHFLTGVKAKLEIDNMQVAASRVEDCGAEAEVVTLRAFRKPLVALELALYVCRPGGKILYWRSQRFDQSSSPLAEEVSARLKDMNIKVESYSKFDLPPEIGQRGLMVFSYGGSEHFPRSIRQIEKDKLAQQID